MIWWRRNKKDAIIKRDEWTFDIYAEIQKEHESLSEIDKYSCSSGAAGPTTRVVHIVVAFPIDAKKTGYMFDVALSPGSVRQFLFWLYVGSHILSSWFVQMECMTHVNSQMKILYWKSYDRGLMQCFMFVRPTRRVGHSRDQNDTCGAHQLTYLNFKTKFEDWFTIGYWPSMIKDCIDYARWCAARQFHGTTSPRLQKHGIQPIEAILFLLTICIFFELSVYHTYF